MLAAPNERGMPQGNSINMPFRVWGQWAFGPLAICLAVQAAAQAYRGLYVVAVPNVNGSKALHAQAAAYRKSFVDGVMIPLHWSFIEPAAPGQTLPPNAGIASPVTGEVFCPTGTKGTNFCWQELDEQISLVNPAKKLSLAVVAGGYSPGWLATNPAYNVAAAGPVLYASHAGNGAICYSINLDLVSSAAAAPGNAPSTFAAAYVAMMQQVAAHLATAGLLQQVSVIKVSGGVNTVTEEFHLDAAATTSGNCYTAATPLWSGLGYTPATTETAWKYMASNVAALFPDALMSFDILENSYNSAPLIDDAGTIFTVAQYNADPALYGTLLLDRALADLLPGNGAQGLLGTAAVAVQWNGIAPADQQSLPAIATHTLAAAANGAVIGWQANEQYGPLGSGCGTAACAAATSNSTQCYGAETCVAEYASMLANGLSPVPGSPIQPAYLEIWPADVNTPCLTPANVAAHNTLTADTLTARSTCG